LRHTGLFSERRVVGNRLHKLFLLFRYGRHVRP